MPSSKKIFNDLAILVTLCGFIFFVLLLINLTIAIIVTVLSALCLTIGYYKGTEIFKRACRKKFHLFAIKGITAFYPFRKDIDSMWEKFFINRITPKSVIFMGQSLSKTFEISKQAEIFVEWCDKSISMKILLLSPEATNSVQLKRVGEGLLVVPDSENITPSDNLKFKIKKTILNIENNVINKISSIDHKPLLRFSKIDLPFSIIAIDDEMFVTFYGTEAEADNQPTIKIFDKNSKAFKSFMKEFENIWNNFSTITPYPDPILKAYFREWDWKHYSSLKESYDKYSSLTTPPRQVIIFPTYQCSNNCSYCMYKNFRSEKEVIDIEALKDIIHQLVAYKVRHIEISGGGEPLEYDSFHELCCFLYELNKDNKLQLGLLTNGIHIDKFKTMSKPNLLDVFNEYIRVSRLYKDNYREDDQVYRKRENNWKENLRYLISLKKKNTKYHEVKIGLKYLLTKTNAKSFFSTVQEDFKDNLIQQVDHCRFRSARDIAADEISNIEQKIYYLLRSDNLIRSNFDKKIALSLPHTHYPANFKCWISPMHVVITPKKEMFCCCNYSANSDSTFLGSLDDHKFKDIWESSKHLDVRRKLGDQICNCNEYCSNCRYAELQQILSTVAYDLLSEP